MSPSRLEYEPVEAARRVVVEREATGAADVTRIVVAMCGPYVPVPAFVWELGLLSLVVWPVCGGRRRWSFGCACGCRSRRGR